MIANTQANPLILPSLGAAPMANPLMIGSAVNAAPSARFDLALLQMAKQTVDSTVTEAELNLVPEKVRKALETVLAEILRKPAEELSRTVSQPSQAGALVTQAAREQGLSLAQHKQLDELVRMAVPRLSVQIQGSGQSLETPVMHSGPSGGTTESLPQIEAPAASDAQIEDESRNMEYLASSAVPASIQPRVQLAGQSQLPALVSTRTQDATGGQAAPSPLSGQAQPRPETKVTVLGQNAPKPMDGPQAKAAGQQSSQASLNQAAPQAQVQAQPTAQPGQPSPRVQAALRQPAGAQAQVELPVSSQELEDIKAVQQPQARANGGTKARPEAALQAQSRPEASSPRILPDTNAGPRLEVAVLKQAPQAPVVQGSEFVLGQPAPRQDAPQAQAVQPQAQAQPGQLSTPAAAQAQVAAALVQSGPEAQAAAPQLEQESAAPSDGAQPRRLSLVGRWMAEQAERATLAGSGAMGQQGGVTVTNQSLRGLAENVAREYSLRESVFEQALAAIEDASQENNHLRIKLRPESLGELEVTLSVEGGRLTARLVAGSAEVRDVFAAHLQQFKQSLENMGLQVSQLSVAVRAETNAQGNSQQNWQQPQPQWARGSREENGGSATWNFPGAAAENNPSRFSALA